MVDYEAGPTYVMPADKVKEATQIFTYPTLSHTALRYSPDGDMWYPTFPEVGSVEKGPYVVVFESGPTGQIYSHADHKKARTMQWNHVHGGIDTAIRAMNYIMESMDATAKRDRAIGQKAGDLLDELQANYPKLTDIELATMHAQTLEFLEGLGINKDTKKRGEVGKAVERIREGSRGVDRNQRPNPLASETRLASAYNIMRGRTTRAKGAEKFIKIHAALWWERDTSDRVMRELIHMYRPDSPYARTLAGTADPAERLTYGQLLGMSRHVAEYLLPLPKLKPYRPVCLAIQPLVNEVWGIFQNPKLSELQKLAQVRGLVPAFAEVRLQLQPFTSPNKSGTQAAA